jgi:hypothetical protein
MRTGPLVRLTLMATSLVVGACAATPQASTGTPPAAAAASPSVNPTSTPTTLPTPVTPTPTATARPAPSPSWSKAALVVGDSRCFQVTAGIDAASRSHIVAACDAGLRYAVSSPGGAWSTTLIAQPANRKQMDPQVGFDGDVVYVAYTWLAVTDGGCGNDGLDDLGVYYRRRTLPDGAWSEATRIGIKDDTLVSFRVEGAILHAVVYNSADGRSYYERVVDGVSERVRLPASGSMRVGHDGRARIAYESSGSIRIATFNGSGFSSTTIPGSEVGSAPVLVLDDQDRAHVVWKRDPLEEAACGMGPAPDPKAGMYYATNASGAWKVQRFSSARGVASLQIAGSTNDVHLVLAAGTGLAYYTKTATGSWQSKRLASGWVESPVIRLDPATGRLLVVFIRTDDDSVPKPGVYVLFK